MQTQRRFAALMMALVLTVGVAEAQTQVKPGFNLFSPEQDVEIGRQSVAEVQRQMPVLSDREVEAYINRIGQKLSANASGPKFPYEFRVVNASDINAFALPGGPIYLNRGIIDNARNEGEVAGVLAHEIAHVALRHGTHQASKAYAAQAGMQILGGLLGGRVGQNTAGIINAVGGFGLNALFLKYSREMETQSDLVGAQILAKSGYTPADMISFFQMLAKAEPSKKTNFLSSHPAPSDRVARIQREAQALRVPSTPTTNVAELNRVQSRLRSAHGTAPTMQQIAQGTRKDDTGPMTSSTGSGSPSTSVEPPASMRTYTSRSRVFQLSLPSNWRVYEEGAGITAAPEGGIGQVGNRTEVVYGAIVNHYEPFGAAESRSRLRSSNRSVYGSGVSIEDATNDLIAQIQSGGKHLKPIRGSSQKFTVSGGPALSVALRGTNPNTRIAERVTVVTRQIEDHHLVYLLFVTPDREAQRYAPVLQAMVNSLRIDENANH
ncbi:MAG: M48 family metalloprotease [Thermoanaerobaculia bacterium]